MFKWKTAPPQVLRTKTVASNKFILYKFRDIEGN